MLRPGFLHPKAIGLLAKCFSSGWADQERVQALASLGHGYLSNNHYAAPTEGIESVQGWIKCLLGVDDDPGDQTSMDLVRVRRWLSWVPQPGHAHLSVLALIRKANAGDTAAKFRLMGVGGVDTGSLAWVERSGNEAFRQSENMAEWSLLMQEMGISATACANFLLGLPLDGVIRAEDRTASVSLGGSLEILWGTGLFLSPLDVIAAVRPARVRKASTGAPGEMPEWSEKFVVADWGEDDYLVTWATKFFEAQHLQAEPDTGKVLAAAGAGRGDALAWGSGMTQEHLFPGLVRRALMQVPHSAGPNRAWRTTDADTTSPEFSSCAARILVV